MRKTAIILAGAALFDLGVMVVPAQAAVDMFLKIDNIDGESREHKYQVPPAGMALNFTKIDSTYSVNACRADKGMVVKNNLGQDQCQFPPGAKGRK